MQQEIELNEETNGSAVFDEIEEEDDTSIDSAIGYTDIDSEEDEIEGERTENFEEMSPEKQKKCRLFMFCVIMTIFICLVIIPPGPLATVDCMEDKFQNKMQAHYDYFAENT